MSKTIVIESKNYDGEMANILFNPSNTDEAINLGDVTLPFTFQPELLIPPREVYGNYTINILSPRCTFFIGVPQPTPTPTPTMIPTITPSVTPSVTPTITPSKSYVCYPTPTPTPSTTSTLTPTPTPTPSKSDICHPTQPLSSGGLINYSIK